MTLYKGRIAGRAHELMDAINRSLPVDIRLLPYDLATNSAWAKELRRLGIFGDEDLAAIETVLDEIGERFTQGEFAELPDDEDVHTLVERLLTEKLGDVGARIHSGRSRNDQVACDLRLYLIDELATLRRSVGALVAAIVGQAEMHVDTLLAGSTHMQPAQPITLAHFLLSLAFGLLRDDERLNQARERSRLCPLGSGALAGAGFAVDREKLAHDLGFARALDNTLDAVSDRDAAQEAASAAAMLTTRLSRYAEQFVLWAAPEFGYVRFADEWSTGSSMMPQKRNPDAMELVRAKAARVIGQATALLTLTKGVPLAYAKDLQEDKALLFDALDHTRLTLDVFAEALASAKFDAERMKAALTGDLLATDLADLLAETGVPFRLAHERVGRFVTELEEQGRDLQQASQTELSVAFPDLCPPPQLTFEKALARRRVVGSPAPESVRVQLEKIKSWLGEK